MEIITLLIFTAVIGSPRKVVKTLITLVLASTIAALIVILPSPIPDSNIGWGRVASIANEFTSANDTTGSSAKSTNIEGGLAGRFNIWNSSIKLARQWDVPIEEPVLNSMLRPLFGLGPDMYVYSYPLIGLPSSWLRLVDHPHNYALHILMEQGCIGLSGFITLTSFLILTTFITLKKYRNIKGSFDITGTIILAVLPAMIGKIFELQTGVARLADLTMTLALFGAAIAIFELLNQQNNAGQNNSMGEKRAAVWPMLPKQRLP